MNKIECYKRAMLAVLRDKVLTDDAKLYILEVLMDAQRLEKTTAEAWKAYRGSQEPQAE